LRPGANDVALFEVSPDGSIALLPPAV
jgi:hypothetical protein